MIASCIQFFVKRCDKLNYQQFCNINNLDHTTRTAAMMFSAFDRDRMGYLAKVEDQLVFNKFINYVKADVGLEP